MFSQNNRPLSPMLNISGEFKRDYKDVKKGTACILQRVIKLKKPIGQEESTLQAVVVGRRGAGRYSYGGIGCTEAYSRR